jgi:serine/threonine protein kinase/WD40 repeat protein
MRQWSITLHGPAGILSSVDAAESQFVIGTETASDVFTVVGDGVKARHAWVWIGEAGMQVEDLGGGTLVNGYQISERVQVEYPASVQVGEVTLVIEVKEVQPVVVSSTPSSIDITIPQRAVTKSKASLEVTIPQRTPTRSSVQKTASTDRPSAPSTSADEASTHCKYTLVREIARGGMGQIYFGEDQQLKRNVAVKVSSVSEAGEDPRFSKEAEVLAQLAHPNIVPIHNIGVDAQGRPFYSMKLVKGRTLQAVLNLIRDGDAAAIKDYPRATLLTIFRKVCDAMMFAHSKGILHRDLKPENIMVGEYGEVLVMDWGLAKVLGEQENNGAANLRVNDTGDYGMTMEGEVMGTPQYMSPEQAMGMVAELDQRSDIYSLGGILYAILTLRPPIDGTTLDEVLTKVKNGSISSMVTKRGGKGALAIGTPTAMGAEVPEALQAVTLKAMATDRNKRYESVEAFAGDIERYQNGFATQAEDAGALRKLMLFVRRNKGLSTAAGLMLVGAIAFTLRLGIEKNRALDALEKTRRAAAAANMLLADAAEAASDSTALKRALGDVPEDLRTPDWSYLRDRIDTATFTLNAPDGLSWVGLEDWPSEPGRMLVLRSDGELFALNVSSGTLQSLWKFNPAGVSSRGPIGVSRDGTLVAISFRAGNDSNVEICRLADFVTVGRLKNTVRLGTGNGGLGQILVNGSICAVQGDVQGAGAGTRKVQVWEYSSGKLLWDAPGHLVDFSKDEQSVLLGIGHAGGETQRREAFSGTLLASGTRAGARIHPNWANNSTGSTDWKRFFSPMYGGEKVRALDPWTGNVGFEVTPRFGNGAVALIPPGDFFAILGRVSPETLVMEIRDATSGRLSQSLPFHAVDKCSRPKAKSGVIALHTPQALKVWKRPVSAPKLFLTSINSGTRLEKTSKVVTHEPSLPAIGLWEGPDENNAKRRGLWKKPGASHRICGSSDGARLIFEESGKYAAYQFASDLSKLEELWASKTIPSLSRAWKIHPNEDRVWTGRAVFEFSTGRILTEIKNRSGFNDAYSPVWIGSNRVAELALKNTAAGADEVSGELLQIALWDTNSGSLLATATAPSAKWISASPDGLRIAEAGADKRVRIRNAQTLEVETEFRAHEDSVARVAWHPLLPRLVTVSTGGVIRVWDRANLHKLEEFIIPPDGSVYLEIPTNGSELVLHESGHIRVYTPESFRRTP